MQTCCVCTVFESSECDFPSLALWLMLHGLHRRAVHGALDRACCLRDSAPLHVYESGVGASGVHACRQSKRSYTALWITAEDLQGEGLLLSRHMMLDHFPDRALDILRRTLSQLEAESLHGSGDDDGGGVVPRRRRSSGGSAAVGMAAVGGGGGGSAALKAPSVQAAVYTRGVPQLHEATQPLTHDLIRRLICKSHQPLPCRHESAGAVHRCPGRTSGRLCPTRRPTAGAPLRNVLRLRGGSGGGPRGGGVRRGLRRGRGRGRAAAP